MDITIMVVEENNYHANFQVRIDYPAHYSLLTQEQAGPIQIETGSTQIRHKPTQLIKWISTQPPLSLNEWKKDKAP